MFFLNSIQFWGAMAAAGVAVPIAIHLVSRYRSRMVQWAAMELLRRALVVRARRVRLEDLVLLMLRCLTILILALALARPAAQGLGRLGEANVGVVIALDSSFSMGHNPSGQSRYDAARERIREILATLTADDQVTVVQLGARARVRLENVGRYDERLQEFLATSGPLPESLNLETCMAELRRLVADLKTTKKECYLVTDAQQTSWSPISASVRDAVHEMAASCDVVFVPVGPENCENLAITRLAVASGVLRKGMRVRYVVDVENTGRHAAAAVPVKLLIGNQGTRLRVAAEQMIERLEPDETASVSLLADCREEGSLAVAAQIGGNDPLPIDNRRYAVTAIRNKIRILSVEPKPVDDEKQNEAFYLYGLLVGSAGGEKNGPVQWKTVAASALQPSDLEGVDVAILTNVGELSHAQAVGLSQFVARGGGLMVFAGNGVDYRRANAQFRDAEGQAILPASLGEPVGYRQKDEGRMSNDEASTFGRGWGLASGPPDHPITGFATTLAHELWDTVHIQRYLRAAPLAGARVLLNLTNDDPFLIERPFGRGSVVLCTTTANSEWADEFANHPVFGILMNQVVMYLSRQSSFVATTVGQDMTCRLPGGSTPEDCHVTGPDGRDVRFRLATGQEGQPDLIFAAELPGIYTLKTGKTEVKLAANVDPRESHVVVIRGRALTTALAGMPLQVVEPGQRVRETESETRNGKEIWRYLLGVVLLLLATEALLGRWFSRRLSAESAPGIRKKAVIRNLGAGRHPQAGTRQGTRAGVEKE